MLHTGSERRLFERLLCTPSFTSSPTEVSFRSGNYGEGKRQCSSVEVEATPTAGKRDIYIRKLSVMFYMIKILGARMWERFHIVSVNHLFTGLCGPWQL